MTATPGGIGGLSVWPSAQTSRATQRAKHYSTDSPPHPEQTLPELAAHVIATYTQPGDLVLDPMVGTGTTLIEAALLGRRGVGVDCEPAWTATARANIDRLRRRGVRADATVITGDARYLPALLGAELAGQVALVLTSPPWGASRHRGTWGVTSEPAWRAGLADLGHHRLISGVRRVLEGCLRLLAPGGHVVLTTRTWRTPRGELIDLPGEFLTAGTRAGLIPVDRRVALTARLTTRGQLIARATPSQHRYTAERRAAGTPLAVLAHHDVLIFTHPDTAATTVRSGRTPPAAPASAA